MPTIYITAGTSWTAPADFNPSNNTVECYGGGAPGFNGPGGGASGSGGGAGSWAKIVNANISPGSVVNIHIGSAGNRDTYFNATSLANAVSNGTGISCGAQGANGQTGGLAASSCGTSKFSGGNGGNNGASDGSTGGGGGGGCAGPNGPGANGGAPPSGASSNAGGAGGGAANNGSVGGNPPGVNPTGAAGGSGRGGTGGGTGGPFGGGGGGNGTANTGSGGGGSSGAANKGGNGALDNVYGDGSHGPGGGGGGGGEYNSFGTGADGGAGGNAAAYGGGGGGGGSGVATQSGGSQGDGLIVITYVIAPPGAKIMNTGTAPLSLRAPSIQASASTFANLSGLTPPQNMSWWQQPTDSLRPPSFALFAPFSGFAQPFPNPLPLFKNPFQTTPDLLVPPRTLDTRQQFPGLAPRDFSLRVTEGADVVSSVGTPTSPINAALVESDAATGFILPSPVKGSADDIVNRVKLLLPKGWWRFTAPIRDAIIGGIADLASWSYALVAYAKLQTRVAWATGIWLDIISNDYFGHTLARKSSEGDASFRTRIQKELIRERVTRKGMINAVQDLTGLPVTVFEPWNTGDTGAWDNGTFALDIAGGWGDYLAAQSFLNVTPPGVQGIAGVGGWDSGYLAWDGGIGMWADMSLITGAVTTQDIYDTINKTRPTGSIVWTQLFPVAKGVPPPAPPTLTPLTILPVMIQQTIYRPPAVQATVPPQQFGGALAVNPVTPARIPTWLDVQPPILQTGQLQAWEPVGFGGALAVNPATPAALAPWLVVQPPSLRPIPLFQAWMPMTFSGARATDPSAALAWASSLPVAQPNPAAYSVPVMPDSV